MSRRAKEAWSALGLGAVLLVQAGPLLVVRPLGVAAHATERRVRARVLGVPGRRQHHGRGLGGTAARALMGRHPGLLSSLPVPCAYPLRVHPKPARCRLTV